MATSTQSDCAIFLSLVTDDTKRVIKIEDRGESLYRSLNGHTYDSRQQIEETDNSTTIVNITTRLDRLLTSNQDKYISRKDFDSTVTPQIVLRLVKQLDCYRNLSPEAQQGIAQDICYGVAKGTPPTRRLFGALLGSDNEHIDVYLADGLNDGCLPLIQDDSHGPETFKLKCRHEGHNHTAVNSDGITKRPILWRKSFHKWCQALMTPFIVWEEEGPHRHYIMKGGGCLAMRDENRNSSAENDCRGGFGQVIKVRIQKGDASLGPYLVSVDISLGWWMDLMLNVCQENGDGVFALKELINPFKESGPAWKLEFDLEVKSLLFVNSRAKRVPAAHEVPETKRHLIQLLATFEIQESSLEYPKYYLLFPWATCNLEQLWEQQDLQRIINSTEHLDSMLKQSFELAKAIRCLHNEREKILPRNTDSLRFGRHGDIKPKNILYFANCKIHSSDELESIHGVLALADFGLGRLHTKDSLFMDSGSKAHATVTYQAPEYDLKNGKLSPKSDIFSYGCVLLEYVTWFLKGWEAVKQFSNRRAALNIYHFETDIFYEISDDKTKATIKDKVFDWIGELLEDERCVEAVRDFLLIIQNDMLEPDPVKRVNSESLVNKLAKLDTVWKGRDSLYGTRHWKQASLSQQSTFSTVIPTGLRMGTQIPDFEQQKPETMEAIATISRQSSQESDTRGFLRRSRQLVQGINDGTALVFA